MVVFSSTEYCRCKKSNKKSNKRNISRNRIRLSEEKRVLEIDVDFSESFQIQCQTSLSIREKFILNSFKNKYLYYAIDDIIDFCKFNKKERRNLFEILYAPILFVHNNRFINFFDIWIDDISIHKISKSNKFFKEAFKNCYSITITIIYNKSEQKKESEPLW